MLWNWQKKDWPNFTYKSELIAVLEAEFLFNSGMLLGIHQHIRDEEKMSLTIDLMTDEAFKTSEIEGEYLNRDSLQSSIKRHFGLKTDNRKISAAEQGIAKLMIDLYQSYQEPLSHKKLFSWHEMLMNGRWDIQAIGMYRFHSEPMQVVSGSVGKPKIHFEAPPSKCINDEMEQFIKWFNNTAPNGSNPLPALTRAGIAHLYFECIHPFEDGNGRIGRAIAEKVLLQSFGQATLLAMSHTIQNQKKLYYAALEKANKSNELTDWLSYFANTIIDAQKHTKKMIEFLVEKTKLYDKVRGHLNARQEKVLARMFREGINGFKGGLSAENYLRITNTSRATATRDLQDLVSRSVLIQTGQLKSTRYYLNINFS